MVTTKQLGDEGEARALQHLQRHGLRLVERNYRLARGPSAHGGEIDLILRAVDGTLVFVEVRQRRHAAHGGAAASIGLRKQQHLWRTAQQYLSRFRSPPPCRFDVVTLEGEALTWLVAAFECTPS
ncbi:MAG: YraN family protein [Pseudomonadota bacterium]